jgi:sarcosine oxidase, subunit beta
VRDGYEVIVIGGGVVGASVAYHLTRFGCDEVLVLDRGEAAGGGTAKSCAIVRTHYSVTSNTELAVASIDIFRDFPRYLDHDDVASGFINSGYLIVAPPGETADMMSQNLDAQREHGANTFAIDPAEATRLHPLLDFSDVGVIAYEPESGYADPYLTTSGFMTAAKRAGVEVRTNTPVTGLLRNGDNVTGVVTPNGAITAGTVISVMGPWTGDLAGWVGADLPLEVSRHTVLTFKNSEPYPPDLPIVKDLTTANKMYFRPSAGGVVLVGTGDHGEPIAQADDMSAPLPDDFVFLQGTQIANRMPSFADAGLVDSWYGPYDITPDWNPVMGRLDGIDGLYLAYGFSGHGFKLAPAVGRNIAQAVLGLQTDVDIDPYRPSRFSEGDLLVGSYGIGSIS